MKRVQLVSAVSLLYSVHLLLLLLTIPLRQVATAQTDNPEQRKLAQQIGEETTAKALPTIMKALTEAISTGGPEYATQFCNLELPSIVKQLQQEHSQGIKLKRVSTRLRNPKNAPDTQESIALQFFIADQQKTAGERPQFFLQETPDGYRYYKPLYIAPLCLTCHGDKKNMDQALLDRIQSLYPEDQAVGYSTGDLRGVLRVEIPSEVIEANEANEANE
jgi:hypothetical protein